MTSLIPAYQDFEDVIHGDLFDVVFDIEGVNLTGMTLLMQVKKGMDKPVVCEFKESDNTLVKSVVTTSITTVTLHKSAVSMKLVPVGLYQYSIVMYSSADNEQTIIEGKFDVVVKIAERPTV